MEKCNFHRFFLFLAFFCFSVFFTPAQESGIQVQTNIPEVKVYINNVFVGSTKEQYGMIYLYHNLKPGLHTIRIEKEGFASLEEKVTIPEKDILVYTRELRPSSVSGRSLTDTTQSVVLGSTGQITVRSKPARLAVEINGSTPNPGFTNSEYKVPVGLTKVRVRAPNIQPLEAELWVYPDRPVEIMADFGPPPVLTVSAAYFLTFNASVKGSRIFIDGKEAGASPLSIKLSYGEHSIQVASEGYSSYSAKLWVYKDDNIEINLQPLERVVSFNSAPAGASVYLKGPDGLETYLGTTPLSRRGLLHGRYTVRMIKTDNVEYNKETDFTLGANEQAKTIFLTLDPKASFLKLLRDETYTPEGLILQRAGRSLGFFGSSEPLKLPPERLFLQVGVSDSKGFTSLADFSHLFQQNHNYTLRPYYPIPLPPDPQKDHSVVPGIQALPPAPDLLIDYTKKTEYKLYDSWWGIPLIFAGLAAILPVTFGLTKEILIATEVIERAEDDLGFWRPVLGWTGAGAAIGFVYAMFPGVAGDYREKRTPIPEAVEENKRRLELYNAEADKIKARNQQLLEAAIREYRKKLDSVTAANQDRGFLLLKDETTGETVKIPFAKP